MAAQKGSAMLLKIGDGGDPEAFSTVAGIRTKSLAINDEMVDVTSGDDAQKWRQLLAGASVKTVSLSGSGVFKDGATASAMLTEKLTPTHKNWQAVVPGLGTFEGAFQLTALSYAAEHNGEVTYDIGLESAGDIAFTAA